MVSPSGRKEPLQTRLWLRGDPGPRAGMMAAASGLDRPHPACASEHVALSPRIPTCASTTLGPQSHDDEPRRQCMARCRLGQSWLTAAFRLVDAEKNCKSALYLLAPNLCESVPQAGSNSRQCDWAALASSDNSLSRAFADLNSVRGDHGTSGCHPGHRRAVNVEQQACRTLSPPLGNCSREAATGSCTVSHTCQGTTGSGDNMRSLAVLARHAAGGSHHSYVGDEGGVLGRWRRRQRRHQQRRRRLRRTTKTRTATFARMRRNDPLSSPAVLQPATRSVFQCLMRWMALLCGRVLLGTGSSSEWSPHWTPHWGVHSLLLLCCRAEACGILQTLCENWHVRHLGEATYFSSQRDANEADWRCPICTRKRCCTQQTCTRKHLHCTRYRQRLKALGAAGFLSPLHCLLTRWCRGVH